MLTVAHVIMSVLLGVIGGVPAGLLTNVIWEKIIGRDSSRNASSTVVIVQSVAETHYPPYSNPAEQPTVPHTQQDDGWIKLGGMVVATLIIDRWYAKHEQLVTTITLVALGVAIGMLLAAAWTFYSQPWLRSKLAWMLGGCAATTYILLEFVFQRMPRSYYTQLRALRAAPHLITTHFHEDLLIAIRLIGWSASLLNIGFILLAWIGLLRITHAHEGRPISRWWWKITEFRTGGLTVLIITGVGFFAVSGLLYTLFNEFPPH